MTNESYDEQLKAAIKGLRADLADKSTVFPSIAFVEKSKLSLVLDHIERMQPQSKAPTETNQLSNWKAAWSIK